MFSDTETTSREPTPRPPPRQSFQTPHVRGRSVNGSVKGKSQSAFDVSKNQNFSAFCRLIITSNFFLWLMFFLSLVSFICFFQFIIPVPYCHSSDVDCRPCPKNAICSGRSFNCVEGAERYKDFCVLPGSTEYLALDLIPFLLRNLSQIILIDELKKIWVHPKKVIRQAVEMIGGYQISKDVYWKRPSRFSQKLIAVTFLGVTHALWITSILKRRRMKR